jgi:hypothetical protein
LARIGKRVVEVGLIAVVNRRTAFSDTLLATVEFEGTRRLVSANDFVAEWSA